MADRKPPEPKNELIFEGGPSGLTRGCIACVLVGCCLGLLCLIVWRAVTAC